MWQPHPQVPWVLYHPDGQGGFVVVDQKTGVHGHAHSELQLHQFAASAAAPPGGGLGDAVKSVLGALGIGKKPCSPCAARQALLNRLTPR